MRKSTHGFPFLTHDDYGALLGSPSGRRSSAKSTNSLLPSFVAARTEQNSTCPASSVGNSKHSVGSFGLMGDSQNTQYNSSVRSSTECTLSFSFSLSICHKGYKREKKKKVLLFTLSWRGSPKEASRLIENGLPQINK